MQSTNESVHKLTSFTETISPDAEKSGGEWGSLIEVHVDDREVGQPVLRALQAMSEVNASIHRLNVGDYELGGRLIIERKTAADFIASIIDGRLFRQASKLTSSHENTLLILEGSGRDLVNSGMSREAIQGALVSLALVFHLPVLRSTDPNESARLMIYAWKQMVRQENDVVIRNSRRPKRKNRAQLFLLQGLPSVGPKRAQVLLEKFGSVRAVMKASSDELMSIPGIKEKSVKAMEWALD